MGTKADKWHTYIHRNTNGKFYFRATSFLSDKSQSSTPGKEASLIKMDYNKVLTMAVEIYGYRYFVVCLIYYARDTLGDGFPQVADVKLTHEKLKNCCKKNDGSGQRSDSRY